MCIIAIKTKESDFPTQEHLKNCFNNNSDGAGFMYVNEGQVVIEKGFMTLSSFLTRLAELRVEHDDFKGHNFVMHFRIGTQGKNDEHTCHPFPISSKDKLLRKTHLVTDIGVVHNGIISDYSYYHRDASHPEYLLSDTQLFIKKCVNAFKSVNASFYKSPLVMEYLDSICKGKLCFLDKHDEIYTLGDFEEENGVLYSNRTFAYDWTSYYENKRLGKKWTHTPYYDDDKGCDEEIDPAKLLPYFNADNTLDGWYITEVLNDVIILEKGDIVTWSQATVPFTVANNDMYCIDEDNNIYYLDQGILTYIGIIDEVVYKSAIKDV